MGKDTRKHKRFRLFAEAVIRTRNSDIKSTVTAPIENISQGGMGLFVTSPIEEGTQVSIEISFTDVMGKKMQDSVDGSVLRVSKQNEVYYLGISFDEEINSQAHPHLYEYFCRIVT